MTPNQLDSSREREIERIAAVLVETGVGMHHDGTAWSASVATYAATELYDAGLRDRAALRERVADVRGSSAQPAYMLGAEDMRAAIQRLLEDTPDVG